MRRLFLILLPLLQLFAADPVRDARWRQDLDFLVTELPRRHPNLYFETTPAAFQNAATRLRAAIPELTDAAVMAGLAALVAMPRDAHTSLSLSQRSASFRQLPLRLQWFEDGLFVTAAAVPYARAIGAKVVRIGDAAVNDAYQAVSALISHENDTWARELSPNYLINADVLAAVGVAPSAQTVWFRLETPGEVFNLEVASLEPGQGTALTWAPDASAGPLPLYRQQTNVNYWFTYLEGSRTLYFAYNTCAEMASLPFALFNQQLWSVFDANPVEHLVIDLRNNPGGTSAVLKPFLASLEARQWRFAAARPYVLIGQRTCSSGMLNAMQMKAFPVVLLGQPSGGSPNGYGETLGMLLPNSLLTVNYSTRYFSFPQFPPGPLQPDVRFELHSSDYFARHDPFLAAVLAGAEPGPATLELLRIDGSGAVLDEDNRLIGASNPALRGRIIQIYGKGEAPDARVFLANQEADVLYSGPHSVYPGLWQINARVPETTPAGEVPLFVIARAAATNAVTVQLSR